MSEMECGCITLKEKLAESEKSITILGQEKETAVHNMEKVAQELKVALEQQRVTVGDLEALQAVHLSLVLISSEAEITSLLLLVSVTDHPHIVWNFTRMKSLSSFWGESDFAGQATSSIHNSFLWRIDSMSHVLLITLFLLIQVQKLQVCETALKDAENLTKELSLKNDTLIKVNTNR